MMFCYLVYQRGLFGNEKLIKQYIFLNNFFLNNFCLLSCLCLLFFLEKCYVLKIEISYFDFIVIYFLY